MSNSIQYDYKQFTRADSTTDYDVKANVAELFDNIIVAKRVVIKTDKTITIKFNNSNLPAIEIVVAGTVNESPFQLPDNFIDVSNIFISNSSGATATISIMLV